MIAGQTPDDVYKQAALDLAEKVSPGKRRVTRYLSLHAVPENQRAEFTRILTFALNSTSFRGQFAKPLPIAGTPLLRIDLEALGWDRDSRIARRSRLEQSGVKFAFKDVAAENKFLDPWEEFAAADVYFKVTQVTAGIPSRGWIDPVVEEVTRKLSNSSNLLLRADWLLPKLLTEKEQGGYYSALLMFPPNETDLYKLFGVDIAFVDRENQLKQGGAVLESVVALHNRELQQIPSLFGYDERFIWRTFDFAVDDVGDKSVLESFAGTVKHDGREIIGSLPNGLHWYYLADAVGKQVAVVPQAIALDMRTDNFGAIKDRNVINAYKCISCHGPVSGTYPFDDVVGKAIVTPEIALAVIAKDKKKVADRQQAIEEYYLSDLGKKISRQQESYGARVKACNGVEPGPNSEQLISWIDRYVWGLVSLEQAAREMGRDVPAAVGILRASGNPQLIVLSAGQPIRRAAFEKAWVDAMRAVVYPWESKAKGY